MVWYRNDHIVEAEKQLIDVNVHKDVSFTEKILQERVGTINHHQLQGALRMADPPCH